MRLELHENLRDYSDLATRYEERQADDQELANLEQLVESKQGQAAQRRQTSRLAQQKIFSLQKDKQEVMGRLRHEMVMLDLPEHRPEADRKTQPVRFDGEHYLVAEKGREELLTWGEVMTDGDWGREYQLDDSVPRLQRKQYLVGQARRRIKGLLDRQIMWDESSSRGTHLSKRGAYRHMLDDRESGREPFGQVAERMVRTFLAKLSYDQPDLDFEIEAADAYDDVEYKIDFIIHRRLHHRGVQIEAVKRTADTGIQFTTNDTALNLQKKQGQLERAKQNLSKQGQVNDIVLVTLPLDKFVSAYRNWQRHGKPAGGPDRYWPDQAKEQIFRRLMAGVLEQSEIEDSWRMIVGGREPAEYFKEAA